MKTNFYINGKKTTRRAILEQFGADRLNRMLKEAKEIFMDDPGTRISRFTGIGMLTIAFE